MSLAQLRTGQVWRRAGPCFKNRQRRSVARPVSMSRLDDGRGARIAPAADRNKEAIRDVLVPIFSGLGKGSLLEVAAGTGQHAAYLSRFLPDITWQPSDVTDDQFDSIVAHGAGTLPNVNTPLVLDASTSATWPIADASLLGVVCINMTHIAPYEATQGLIQGSGRVLRPEGVLCIYGPFTVDGKFTTDSNKAFHHSLRNQDPSWGYRDINQLKALALEAGLELVEIMEMPANNFTLIFRKRQ